MTIPDFAPSDFGIRATATAVDGGFLNAPEQATTATDTFDVSWTKSSNTFEETVSFTNQSIWSSDVSNQRHELSFKTVANASPGVDLASTLVYANLTAGGVGAKTHISGAIGVNSFINFVLENKMFVEGGGTTGGVTYDGQISVLHNKVTDMVQFDTSAMADLAKSSFVAGSPNFGFSTELTNLIFNLSAYAKIWGYVHFKTGVSTTGPEFDVGVSGNVGLDLVDILGPGNGLEILGYDGSTLSVLNGLATQQGTTFTKTFDSGAPFENELATVTVTNPQLNSTSTALNATQLGAGARQEFANFTLDLDGIAATIKGIQNPASISKTIGDPSGSFFANFSLDALDLDLINKLSYQQNHILTPGDLSGTLVLEGGDRFDFKFGDKIDVGTLASHDANGDGQLSYHFELDPDAQFQTKAQMVFEQFDQLEILQAAFGVGLNLGPLNESISKTLGPWKSTNRNVIDREAYIPITTQDFALAFDEYTTSTFFV